MKVTKFRGFRWDILGVLALVVLLLFFLSTWLLFRWKVLTLQEFTAYATFGTALGTTALALATFYMAGNTSQQMELTRLSLEKPVIAELIVRTIDPLQDSLNDRYEEAQDYYLYDIPMPFLIEKDVMLSPPHTPKDWGIGMIDKGTRYADLERLYPQICADIQAYEKALRELRSKLINILDKIDTRLQDPQLAKIVGVFPPDSRIPLRYLPFWELLKRVGKTVPHPGYDRYKLWSEKDDFPRLSYEYTLTREGIEREKAALANTVESFWQRNGDSITEVISSDQEIMKELNSLTHSLDNLEPTCSKVCEALTAARNQLEVKYNLSDQELKQIKAFWQKEG
jgi:hypothetical protein